jgi:glycosyltransferase involved in cell wall biosynthesis
MRLAVVIPCYNHSRYIERAIRSVLGQTRPVDRLIVIDDGSSDDSVAVVRAMGESRVELHVQENQNAFNTINRGVAMAAADCDAVAILNSDDHYHPRRFERMLPVLESDPEAMVVCSALHIVDESDRDLPPDHPRGQWFRAIWSLEARDDLDLAEWLGLGNFPATTSNLLGRAAYFAANPMRPYHFNHDYYFLTGAAVRGVLRILPEPLVNYRVHSTNTMNTRPARLIRELLRQQVDFLREFHAELAAGEAARRRYKLYLQAAFENVSAFDAGLFLHVLGQALQRAPAAGLDEWILALGEADYPELTRFPNRHHVTSWPGGGPLGGASALPEKLDAVRAERDRLKEEATDRRELTRLLARAAGDRRHALGRLLGLAPRLGALPGKSAGEKLAALRALAAGSHWLRCLR